MTLSLSLSLCDNIISMSQIYQIIYQHHLHHATVIKLNNPYSYQSQNSNAQL